MVKVSVIMPVYNGEDYLEKSVDCILNQTLTDWEMICVDDGSTDSSLEILNKIASKDSRISVYHQENRGGGAARNSALQHATGEYLYFMDADDELDLNAFSEFYEISKEHDLDFVIFKAINYAEDTGEYFETDYYNMAKIANFASGRVFSFDDLGDLIFNISVTPWCKFYNLDFVKRSGAKFRKKNVFYRQILLHKAQTLCLINRSRRYKIHQYHKRCKQHHKTV